MFSSPIQYIHCATNQEFFKICGTCFYIKIRIVLLIRSYLDAPKQQNVDMTILLNTIQRKQLRLQKEMQRLKIPKEHLLRFVSETCSIDTELGEKGRRGILKSMESRADFLHDPNHQIRFVYTPKHSSWMNQIEIWFGIINGKLLKRKSYISIEDLEKSILRFIEQYNLTAHPFKWTYAGVPLGDLIHRYLCNAALRTYSLFFIAPLTISIAILFLPFLNTIYKYDFILNSVCSPFFSLTNSNKLSLVVNRFFGFLPIIKY